MNMTNSTEIFYPKNKAEWRSWLEQNHRSANSVWLVYYKKKSKKPSLTWSEAVDEALCFGWIDSKAVPIDEDKYMQFFGKRKPKSVWSKINKEKILRLTQDGHMTEAGFEIITIAKENGSWYILDEVEELVVPTDLQQEFEKYKDSEEYFLSLSKSVRKSILQWLVTAKKAETRQKRINEIATLAAQKLKPKPF